MSLQLIEISLQVVRVDSWLIVGKQCRNIFLITSLSSFVCEVIKAEESPRFTVLKPHSLDRASRSNKDDSAILMDFSSCQCAVGLDNYSANTKLSEHDIFLRAVRIETPVIVLIDFTNFSLIISLYQFLFSPLFRCFLHLNIVYEFLIDTFFMVVNDLIPIVIASIC